ncbi:UNVERIFIED_CONTAM: atg16 [Trichonephila clavipes]
MRSECSTNEILLQGRITSLDLSLDGYSLLSCVRDDSLKLIDFRMNNVVRTFRLLLREGLQPYCYTTINGHLSGDFLWQIEFCKWFNNMKLTMLSFYVILWTDGTQFTHDAFNNQNTHTGSVTNPHATCPYICQDHCFVNMWVGVQGNHLIQSYLLRERFTGICTEYCSVMYKPCP